MKKKGEEEVLGVTLLLTPVIGILLIGHVRIHLGPTLCPIKVKELFLASPPNFWEHSYKF